MVGCLLSGGGAGGWVARGDAAYGSGLCLSTQLCCSSMHPERFRFSAENCSIRRTLDVVGEKWTLLVLREAFYGVRRFEQFLANVGCARTLLSERLATLVEHGVLHREPYREAGQRERHQYLLTDKGHDLFAALVVLMHWGDRWEAGPDGGPVVARHSECGQPV